MKTSIFALMFLALPSGAFAQEAKLEQFSAEESPSFDLLVPGAPSNDAPVTEEAVADETLPKAHSPAVDVAASPVTELSSRPLYVPAWMRGGRSPFRTSLSSRLASPSDPDCLATAYFPRFGISPEAQSRRRLHFEHIVTAACEAGAPVHLFDALVAQESRYRPF
ncbi:MAG: hypothetical protein AAFU66_10410, partial [Pseudomonadota bacterium]